MSKQFEEIFINNLEITDEKSLKSAFNFIVNTIEEMSNLLQQVGFEYGLNIVLNESSDSINENFNKATERIKEYGINVKNVSNKICEYITKGSITTIHGERQFISENAAKLINTQTSLAQIVVKNYEDGPSIEIFCQVYDATINEFNSSVNVMNEVRKLNVSEAEPSNLTAIYQTNLYHHN